MSLEADLAGIVGATHVLTDPALRAPYETDWTRRFSGMARAVVRPASTAEVAAVVAACGAARVPIVVQGGNTGLVGGGVPSDVPAPRSQVLLSTSRLADLEPVDPIDGQVTAGAGVSLARLTEHARAAGFDFGVDLAARSQASLGGLVATNAGGIRVLRYGSMRAQLVGIEAVLPDAGVVSRLGGLLKDNTGYDLTGLLAGSEGTLAVITKVRLRLVPLLAGRAVALAGVADTAGALHLLAMARSRLDSLSAAEVCYPSGLDLVCRHAGLQSPFPARYGAYLVLECAARADPSDDLLEVLQRCSAVGDATLASDAAGRNRLWAYREQHTEAIAAAGIAVKLDVSVPLAQFATVVDALPAAVTSIAPLAQIILFGHINEGNLHVNLLDAGPAAAEVTDAVLRLVAAHRGSISSEHGIGRAKSAWLGLSRSPQDIAAMHRIKAAFDPGGLLGPGVLFPPPG